MDHLHQRASIYVVFQLVPHLRHYVAAAIWIREYPYKRIPDS